MISKFRTDLTIWFVFLFVLLYVAGGVSAHLVFSSELGRSLDDELEGLVSEIRPSIRVNNDSGTTPSLKHWAERVNRTHAQLVATTQLYDERGNLLEEYGPPGVPRLEKGFVKGDNDNSVKSLNVALKEGTNEIGYLQVQVSTKHMDTALRQFWYTLLLLTPFLAIAVFVCGYFFSGRAVKPLGESLILLRRFVADAGHEFNTPISIIEASVETLEPVFKENNINDEILQVISRASKRMKNLASNLMLLARTEKAELLSPRVPVNIRDLIESVIYEHQDLAKKKAIDLTAGEIVNISIVGHGESLYRMLSNLIDNAIAYTDKGAVTINSQVSDKEVIISVIDTGIGMAQDALPHIFNRFYRVDKSRSRQAGGAGLGLSIVKAIVEAHKGNIHVESQPGQGTKFVVSLPIK